MSCPQKRKRTNTTRAGQEPALCALNAQTNAIES